ncbi:MAG TPA: alpha-N-arabinofuranosidase [Candidatus Dormibacteraeota bacterium]|jgi:alpha-N-arabinofuranosidase|nr:alpha-N-arabinofuranosidase [Candidatus Dormibacteraeota bacterium]
MEKSSRRTFVKNAAVAGAGTTAGLALGSKAWAQSASAATRVYLDTRRTIGAIDRNIFGSFLEHLGRAIYEGVYEPGSKFADANGFRKDVLDEVKSMGVPIVRYPGGNFVSGYHWLDGVGPKEKRPRVLEKAWDSVETNQFGTNEFMAWCKATGAAPLMGMNFGTATAEQAAALLEYCNVERGTKWSDLRREHGVEKPHNVKHWCLGNEMDGWWQIGHMTAKEYGSKAADAGRQMRAVDPNVKLIACGSSGPGMPTYLEWDREVLEQCYEDVDAISLHRYYGNNSRETGDDSTKYMALNLAMEKQIEEVAAVCDYVQGRKKSSKRLWLSFDEWNVWYRKNAGDDTDGHRKVAPHLLEEIYNLEDALLVGGLINALLRHTDRVKIACLAQLVNVIAPIMTNESGLFRQTIFYPYAWALQNARGATLEQIAESPTYEVSGMGPVAYVDVASTFDKENGKTVLFVFNRDLSKTREVEFVWEDTAPSRVTDATVLTGDDLKAVNGFDAPTRVAPRALEKPVVKSGKMTFEVPARSYSMIQLGA